VLIGAAGTPGATPQKELAARNYQGRVYQTHGSPNPDFLRVVGKDGNGTILPAGPMLVYEQLPESNPVKKSAAGYVRQYEAKFGTRATFGGHAWDTYPAARACRPRGAAQGEAWNPGVPGGAARCARRCQGVAGVARRVP